MGSVAQCTSLVTGETRLVPAKAAAGLQKGSQPFLLWIHSMRKCESEKGKIVEINGCERAGNASNILHHCCGSINFSRKNVRNPFQNVATIAQFVQPHCSNILQTLSLLWHDLPLVSVFSATLEFILFLYCIQNNEACQSKTKGWHYLCNSIAAVTQLMHCIFRCASISCFQVVTKWVTRTFSDL